MEFLDNTQRRFIWTFLVAVVALIAIYVRITNDGFNLDIRLTGNSNCDHFYRKKGGVNLLSRLQKKLLNANRIIAKHIWMKIPKKIV